MAIALFLMLASQAMLAQCSNLVLNAIQIPCTPNANDVLNPGVDFTFSYNGSCTVDSIFVILDVTEYGFAVDAPNNVSGSIFGLTGFPENAAFSAYYTLADGTPSDVFDFTIGDCSQDAIICDCDGNQHTIGVLSWLGDTYADNAAYTWVGVTVNFDCATWGYDCGDIAGAPAEDPYDVCGGNLPPNNGCEAVVFGCTDDAANNYNPDATVDDGSCMYDIAGCTDPTANNYDPMANINDGSCTYGACSNLVLLAAQTPCTPDADGVLNPSVEFTFDFEGTCTVAELIINLDGTEYPFTVDAPNNVSGSIFGLSGFPANVAFSAYYTLADGTPSDVFDFTIGDCTLDPVICDCDGNQHTIGVLSWLGDTYADDASFTWAGVTVNFNCSTWGYDCGDIAGAPAEDPYDVCGGNLPPNNGCVEILGCIDPLASNYDSNATTDDGSCVYDDCVNLVLNAIQTPCTPDADDVLNPGVDFTFSYNGSCTVDSIFVILDATEYGFAVDAPANVSGSVFGLIGFPSNVAYSAYFALSDGTLSPNFDFNVGDCSQDAIICDCDGNQHTIGVLSWLGDNYADTAAYTWAGSTVNFGCPSWGYDCGDIAGAPAEDTYGVCDGNLPPNNGCATTSVDEFASVMFEAYPNPTSGMLTLVNRGEGGNKQIRVFDQTGKLQIAEQRSMNAGASEQFNLSNLAAGTYHVQVVGNNGVSNITVIIQK